MVTRATAECVRASIVSRGIGRPSLRTGMARPGSQIHGLEDSRWVALKRRISAPVSSLSWEAGSSTRLDSPVVRRAATRLVDAVVDHPRDAR